MSAGDEMSLQDSHTDPCGMGAHKGVLNEQSKGWAAVWAWSKLYSAARQTDWQTHDLTSLLCVLSYYTNIKCLVRATAWLESSASLSGDMTCCCCCCCCCSRLVTPLTRSLSQCIYSLVCDRRRRRRRFSRLTEHRHRRPRSRPAMQPCCPARLSVSN